MFDNKHSFHHYFFQKYGVILPFAMEPLNQYLVMELKATQDKMDDTERRNTKLIEENLWLEARLDREVERTSDLTRWFQYFVNSNVSLEQEVLRLREHCQRLERRLIIRDTLLDRNDDNTNETSSMASDSDDELPEMW